VEEAVTGTGKRSGAHERRRTDFGGKGLFIATCPDCGKRRYRSRRDAKQEARQMLARGIVVTRAYRCGDYWHLTSQDTGTTTRQREAL